MSLVTNTATTVELASLYVAVDKLEVMLRPYNQGDALGGAVHKPGRFTQAQIDTQIAAVSAAITAVNA